MNYHHKYFLIKKTNIAKPGEKIFVSPKINKITQFTEMFRIMASVTFFTIQLCLFQNIANIKIHYFIC